MTALILLKSDRQAIREEAEMLEKLKLHIENLQDLYRTRSLALIKNALKESHLNENMRAVEAMETDDGFAIEFRFKK